MLAVDPRRWLVLATLTLAALIGGACSNEEPLRPIAIDVKTDFVAGREFAAVGVYGGTPDEGESPSFDGWLYALPGEDFDRGVRIGVAERKPGEMYFQAELWDEETLASEDPFAEPIAFTVVLIEDTTIPALTLVVSRSCSEIECTVGADREFQMCHGGTCGDIRCSPETSEHCPPPQCTTDAECTATQPCMRARCEEGVCFATAHDELCPAGEVCDDTGGCTAQ